MNELLFEYMKAQDKLADDLPDGSYLQFLQDSVDIYNSVHNTFYDSYETMMEYIKLTSSKG